MMEEAGSGENRRTQSPLGAEDSDGADAGSSIINHANTPQPPASINLLHYILNQKKMDLTGSPEVIQWLRESQEKVRADKMKSLKVTHSQQIQSTSSVAGNIDPLTQAVAATNSLPMRKRFRSLSADRADERHLFMDYVSRVDDDPEKYSGEDADSSLTPLPAKNPRLHPKPSKQNPAANKCGDLWTFESIPPTTVASNSSTDSLTLGPTLGNRMVIPTSQSDDRLQTSNPDLVLPAASGGDLWSWSEGGSAFTTVTRSNPPQ